MTVFELSLMVFRRNLGCTVSCTQRFQVVSRQIFVRTNLRPLHFFNVQFAQFWTRIVQIRFIQVVLDLVFFCFVDLFLLETLRRRLAIRRKVLESFQGWCQAGRKSMHYARHHLPQGCGRYVSDERWHAILASIALTFAEGMRAL